MSKLKNIKYEKLEMQTYLKSQKISLIKKRVLFKARTRMLNVQNNFGKKSQCPLCKLNDNDQSHLIDFEKMNIIACLLLQAIRTREKII